MKSFIFLLLILSFTMLYANSGFSVSSVNQSSTSRALGDITGVANIWSGDPLNVWSNPALVVFHKGLRIGYSHDKWGDDSYFSDPKLYLNSTYASYARNGWGFSAPMPNYNGKLGSSVNYGKMGMYEEDGAPKEKDSYDIMSEFTLAHDIMVDVKKHDNRKFAQALNASVGISLNVLAARYEQAMYNDYRDLYLQKIKADGYPLNVGVLFYFDGAKYFGLKNLDLQASLGCASTNLFESKIRYVVDDSTHFSDKLARDNSVGAGLFFGLPTSLLINEPTSFTAYCPHLLTVLFMAGNEAKQYDADETGNGLEVGILDILYIRTGNHNIIGNAELTTSSGWGIKLHYGKKWEFQYNAASFGYGSYFIDQHSQDISIAYHM